MRRKTFPLPNLQLRFHRQTGLLILVALFAGFVFWGIVFARPARADSGGFPTRTPTVTPSPTATSTPTATFTPTSTLQAAAIAETPIPPTPDLDAGQAAITLSPTTATTTAGPRPNLVCWPFALLVVIIAVLVGSVVLGNNP